MTIPVNGEAVREIPLELTDPGNEAKVKGREERRRSWIAMQKPEGREG